MKTQNYVTIINRFASNSLYAWKPVEFTRTLSAAMKAMLQPKKSLKLKHGDMTAVIHIDHVSDVVPNIGEIGIFDGVAVLELPKITLPRRDGGKNWIAVFESNNIECDDFWDLFGYYDTDLFLRIVAECYPIIENVPYVDDIVKSTFMSAMAWVSDPTEDYDFAKKAAVAAALYTSIGSDLGIEARVRRVTLLAAQNICSLFSPPKSGHPFTQKIRSFMGSMAGADAMSTAKDRYYARVLMAQRIRPLISFQESMLVMLT